MVANHVRELHTALDDSLVDLRCWSRRSCWKNAVPRAGAEEEHRACLCKVASIIKRLGQSLEVADGARHHHSEQLPLVELLSQLLLSFPDQDIQNHGQWTLVQLVGIKELLQVVELVWDTVTVRRAFLWTVTAISGKGLDKERDTEGALLQIILQHLQDDAVGSTMSRRCYKILGDWLGCAPSLDEAERRARGFPSGDEFWSFQAQAVSVLVRDTLDWLWWDLRTAEVAAFHLGHLLGVRWMPSIELRWPYMMATLLASDNEHVSMDAHLPVFPDGLKAKALQYLKWQTQSQEINAPEAIQMLPAIMRCAHGSMQRSAWSSYDTAVQIEGLLIRAIRRQSRRSRPWRPRGYEDGDGDDMHLPSTLDWELL